MTTIADRLAWARNQSDFRSARDFALQMGHKEATYRAHETGRRGVPNEKAETYARQLGVNPVWLITGSGEPKKGIKVRSNGGLAEPAADYQAPPGEDDDKRLLQSLYPGHPLAFWMRVNTSAVDLAGILPGDFVIVDPDLERHLGEPVIAQVYSDDGLKAETVLRLYDESALMPRSTDRHHVVYMLSAEDSFGNPKVKIMGVIAATYRPPARAG